GRCCVHVARLLPLVIVGSVCFLAIGCGDGASMHGTRGMRSAPDSARLDPDSNNYDKLNAETYGLIVENPFHSPLVAPRSTFSADVNTASYSNVRRMLMQGQLPPRDAVFLAEMVNYFPYRYPEPTGDNPVSLTVDLGACPWNPEHKLARIGVRAR